MELHMNKAEFIDAVALKAGLSKKDAKAAVEAMLDTFTQTLATGESVTFIGFGAFIVRHKEASTAKVPGTDRTVAVPAKNVVSFKVGKALKDAVK